MKVVRKSGGWCVVVGKRQRQASALFGSRQAAINYLGQQFFRGLRTLPATSNEEVL